jgi:hypothetical protein
MLVSDSKLWLQIHLGFFHLLRIYIYVVLLLPMLLLLTDETLSGERRRCLGKLRVD